MKQSTESGNDLPSHDGKRSVIRSALIFSSLNDAEESALASISVTRKYPAGEFIFMENDPPDNFFIVASGQVKVVKQSVSGKEFIVAFFNRGEMFGEVAVFENKPYPASAQSASSSEVLAIPRIGFLSFLAAQPQVALRIIGILGGRLREAQGRLKDLAVERVEQRIASTLLMLSYRLGPEIPFTRQDIADMTGTTTETAIRTITRFKASGIINTSRGKIIIVNPEKLRLLSDGPPIPR